MTDMNFGVNLLPDGDGSRNLGSSAKKWNVYADGGNVLTDSDIVDNLSSTETDKVLSAAQGKALNDKITYLAPLSFIHDINLDTMKTTGLYVIGYNNTSCPTDIEPADLMWSAMLVIGNGGDTSTQVFFGRSGTRVRSLFSGVWGAWRTMA